MRKKKFDIEDVFSQNGNIAFLDAEFNAGMDYKRGENISEIISKDSINFIEGVAIYIAALLIFYDIKASFARNITPNTNEPIYIEPKNSLSSSRRIARRGGNNGNMLPCVRRLCHKCN